MSEAHWGPKSVEHLIAEETTAYRPEPADARRDERGNSEVDGRLGSGD